MKLWHALTKQLVGLTFILGAIVGGASLALADWAAPVANAPTCATGNAGCDAPLNTSATGQSKSGGLTLNTGGATNGLIVSSGKVGIDNVSPVYTLDVTGTANITSTLAVAGATTLSSTVSVGSNLTVTGAASVGANLTVSGAATINSIIVAPGISSSNGNRAACYIDATTRLSKSTTACTNPSDIRLKENVVDTPSMLEVIKKIRIVNFDLKDDPQHTLNTGVIAQELYNVLPYMVTVGGDDPKKNPWGVSYTELGVVALKGVQELNLKIDRMGDSVKTKELCVGDVCVSEAEFLKLVGSNHH
jgi:hypothetical protein